MNAPTIDNDTAHTVMRTALELCKNIIRDYPWAKSGDAQARHRRSVSDLRANFIPRFSPVMAALAQQLLTDAEAAADHVFTQ